jgi:hypothetical protein
MSEALKPPYYTAEEMIGMIDEPNQTACFNILRDNRKLFQTVQGSTHNHQAWRGGYIDHVQEIMNYAILLYGNMSMVRPLPFSLSDALLTTYLHDVEKPWKYELGSDGQLQHRKEFTEKSSHHEFRLAMLNRYGVALTSEQENGIRYAEGELNDYTNQRRVMGPLAAFTHMCDVASARLWFDYPMVENDPWDGAKRFR